MKMLPVKLAGNWRCCRPITYGWSRDRKYYLEDAAGTPFLLRLAEPPFKEAKRLEFERLRRFNALPFPMSRALRFGVDKVWVFQLLSWVPGNDLRSCLAALPATKQYSLGREAGKIQRQMHALPVAAADRPAEDLKLRRLEKLARYEASSVRIPGDQAVLAFLRRATDQPELRPPSYLHGDFHVGNLILTPKGKLGVIDFNRQSCGDPYEEFLKIQSFDLEISIPFSRGRIDGYFSGPPPETFWNALAVYVAHTALTSINWAEPFGAREVQNMQCRALRAFTDYDYFHRRIPRWYQP